MLLDALLLNPRLSGEGERDNSPVRKAPWRGGRLRGSGSANGCFGPGFESLGHLRMFKGAEAEIQVLSDDSV